MRERYRRNLRAAVGASGAPYGYTLTVWTSGALLIHVHGLPDIVQVLLFMAGAVAGYALAGFVAFGGLGEPGGDPEPPPKALWGNLHFASIGLAICGSYLASHGINNVAAWPATGLAATAIYLLVLGAELSAASSGARD